MGQSNSTIPLDAQQNVQVFHDFNYSRLVDVNNEKKQNKKVKKLFSGAGLSETNAKEESYFKMNKFQSLSGDDLLFSDRISSGVHETPQNISGGTLRNISHFKLPKHGAALLSRNKLTSIANLQLPQQDTPAINSPAQSNLYLRAKASHVKFASAQRLICQNFIYTKSFDQQTKKYVNKIIHYFVDEESMHNYASNLVKLNQVLHEFSLYDNFNTYQEAEFYVVERTFVETIDFRSGKLTKSDLKANITKLLDFLHFLAKIYQRIDHIYIDPEDIYYDENDFFMADFKYKESSPFDMILATLEWVFKSDIDQSEVINDNFLKIPNKFQKSLQECFFRRDQLQNSSSFPFYIRQLWKNIVQGKILRSQLLPYIERLKHKAISLSMNIDSLHACLNHKRTWTFHEQKHPWMIGKRVNELYFYNLNDDHRCQAKVVRKKRKIDLSQFKLMFDPEQLVIKYVAENSKLIVQINEIQLQKSSCKSDIQIKHRLPVKFKNPFLFYNSKKQQIFILQGSVYKYSNQQNKLSQQTKRIPEHIFLARSYDYDFMVVKISLDIFRNGIKLFFNQTDVDLHFVAEEDLHQQMMNVRVDIRNVEFCKQVYKGVYLLMANRNMWILDLNFKIFYSFATLQRLKSFYGFASVPNSTTVGLKNPYQNRRLNFSGVGESGGFADYAFEFFNQPFKVEFLNKQDGLNVKIKDDQLHIIGEIECNLYYLRYAFLPEAGSLRLIEYKPLMAVNSKRAQIEQQHIGSSSSSLNNNKKQQKKPKKATIATQINEYIEEYNMQQQNLNKKPITNMIINGKKRKLGRKSIQQPIEMDQQYLLAAPIVVNNETHEIYVFNFYQQNLHQYKTQSWLYFEDRYFIRAEDLYLKPNKTSFEIQLKIPKTVCSLKDLVEKMKKYNEDKSAKQRKYFTREQCLLFMIRCLDIYNWLVRNEFYHKNLMIANYYFMAEDNSMKLIGWSQPQRNWYVSDYKDLLLVFFNIITCNTLQKLNQKMLFKYKTQLEQFSIVYDKMLNAFKYMKISEKKGEIARELKEIKDYLYSQICNRFLLKIMALEPEENRPKQPTLTQGDLINNKTDTISTNKPMQRGYVFNFQYNTPRFSMICLTRRKLKKMFCLIDQNSKQQFIFQPSDKYIWTPNRSILSIFTTNYQFYELKINTTSFKQQTLVCEDYEYLPHNILDSTFIITPSHGIVSVGGVYRAKDSELTFNKTVYRFNTEKLTWDAMCEIPQPRINPYLAMGNNQLDIYCFGGEIQDHSSRCMNLIKISLSKMTKKPCTATLLKDMFKFNPLSQIPSGCPTRIYNLSSSYLLFLLFTITSEYYIIRLFSLNSFCIDLTLQTKNYSDDNKSISSSVGITLIKDNIHVLRQYGKHAKISLNRLQNLTITNETFYPQREDKAE